MDAFEELPKIQRPDAAPPTEGNSPRISGAADGAVSNHPGPEVVGVVPTPRGSSDPSAPPPSDATPVAWRWRLKGGDPLFWHLTNVDPANKAMAYWRSLDLPKCIIQPLYAHPEDAPRGPITTLREPLGCYRDHGVAGLYCWFVRFRDEYRSGPFMERTARLIYRQEKERQDRLKGEGETDG